MSALDKCTKVPLEKALKPFDNALVLTDRWWVVVDNCILFYRGYSPQCNSQKEITELSMRRLYPKAEAVYFPVIYVEHRCEQ